ncbi:MAG TPA: hypothetical protein VGL69_22510 [Solirubrobacteraceae bacterium]
MTSDSSTDPDARAAVYAMWQGAYALGAEGRFRDQIERVHEIRRRFAQSPDPEVRAMSVRTLAGQMYAAVSAGERCVARAVTRDVTESLDSERDLVVQVAVAETALEMAGTLAFAPAGSPSPVASIALAPLARWPSLRRRARIRAAHARRELILDGLALALRLVDALTDSTVPSLRSVAAQAQILAGAANTLLMHWRQVWPLFEPLFQEDGARVASVIDNAKPGSDGSYTSTERAAAAIARRTHIASQTQARTILRGSQRRGD